MLGHSIDDPASFLSHVGALIDSPAFYSALSACQNLRLLADVGAIPTAGIDVVLDIVGLTARADDAAKRYSLGMRQRLGIAAALLPDPTLLVLDEPTNGLDPVGIQEIHNLLSRLADEERTVLVSSHLLSELEHVSDWLVVLDGRFIPPPLADTGHCLDQTRLAKFPSKCRHRDPDGVGEWIRKFVPQLVQRRLCRHDVAISGGEYLEHPELLPREDDVTTSPAHLPTGTIDGQIPPVQDRWCGPTGSSAERTQPGKQFDHRERFAQVVVGT